MTASRLSVAAMLMILTLVACGGGDPPPPPAPTGPSEAELAAQREAAAREQAARDAAARAQAEADRARAEADRLAAAQRGLRTALEAMVHFEYDEADITSEAEGILRDKVDILRANPGVSLRIVGHADERGSTEYNLALGSRRAESVRTFFTGFGLEGGRFQTSSLGEEQPLVNRSDEAAWAQNRRAEFTVTGGGGTLQPPR
jgi:peptidoglycan-associated lipoprotein